MRGPVDAPDPTSELCQLVDEFDSHICQLRTIRSRKQLNCIRELRCEVRVWRDRAAAVSSWPEAFRLWKTECELTWCIWRIRLALSLYLLRDPKPAVQRFTSRIVEIIHH